MTRPTNDNDPEIEYSALCGKLKRGGTATHVQIYRMPAGDQRWIEVINEEGTSTVWDDGFGTDVAALAEFERTIEEEGIESFLSARQ